MHHGTRRHTLLHFVTVGFWERLTRSQNPIVYARESA
nr:MAG TPA: hypothetical protein [Caudoviricetes sp.]